MNTKRPRQKGEILYSGFQSINGQEDLLRIIQSTKENTNLDSFVIVIFLTSLYISMQHDNFCRNGEMDILRSLSDAQHGVGEDGYLLDLLEKEASVATKTRDLHLFLKAHSQEAATRNADLLYLARRTRDENIYQSRVYHDAIEAEHEGLHFEW